MVGEKQKIVDVAGREYLCLFTRHLASNRLVRSILDQLFMTATGKTANCDCIGLLEKIYRPTHNKERAKRSLGKVLHFIFLIIY